MKVTRRQALRVSGTAFAGLSLGLEPRDALAQAPQPVAPVPDTLIEPPLRNIAPLPLLADGSAPEHTAQEIGTISEPYLWRYNKNQAPVTEFDYRKLRIRVDARGLARRSGTLTFADLESLPRHSAVHLLQCGAPNPRGIVRWTGVRFVELAKMLGVQPFAHYARFVASDRYFIDEDIKTLMHPQVMLAWLLNDQPLSPQHGAPLRLVMPFRYGAHSIKAITEIHFHSTGVPTPPLPVAG